jgi:hypothetical protein
VGVLSFIPGIAIIAYGVMSDMTIVTIFGAVVMILLGGYVVLRLSLSEVACVVGNKNAVEAVKNSWAVVKGNIWGILLITIGLGILDGIIGGIVSYVNAPIGSFANTLFAYPITIAYVLIYKQLASKGKAKKK